MIAYLHFVEVTGSLTDPSRAAVPGVKVTVRHLDKNPERAFIANDSGLLAKTFSIRERVRADIRAEMFNAFNRVRFGQGSLTIQTQTFGILSQTAGDQINSPRQMQLALKLYF